MHLGELELRLGPHARRERRVADDVSQSLPGENRDSCCCCQPWIRPLFASLHPNWLCRLRRRPSQARRESNRTAGGSGQARGKMNAPLRLELLKDLALGVVSHHPGFDGAAQIKLLRPEHRHLGGGPGIAIRSIDDAGGIVLCSRMDLTLMLSTLPIAQWSSTAGPSRRAV